LQNGKNVKKDVGNPSKMQTKSQKDFISMKKLLDKNDSARHKFDILRRTVGLSTVADPLLILEIANAKILSLRAAIQEHKNLQTKPMSEKEYWDATNKIFEEHEHDINSEDGYIEITTTNKTYRSIPTEFTMMWVSWEPYEVVGHFSRIENVTKVKWIEIN
jgi:hypothetical protein